MRDALLVLFDHVSCPINTYRFWGVMQGHLLRQVGGAVPVAQVGV